MEPVEVLKSLGIGWGVYELYPNPTNQPAFASAIERLEPVRDHVIVFEIGAGTITCEGEVVELARGGAERLALRLFVHEVEWLQIVGQPSPDELSEFFRLLSEDENDMRESGGIESVLRGKNVSSLSVTQRGLLVEGPDNAWEESQLEAPDPEDLQVRAEEVAHMIQTGATAETVAGTLMRDAAQNPQNIAEAFCEAYRTIYPTQDEPGAPEEEGVLHLLGAAYKPAGPRRRPPVDTFAEAFFLLPNEAQAEVLTLFLVNRNEGLHGLLLDQFAGLELADLAPQLDEEAFAELEAYVRDVVDTDFGTADELLPLVNSAREVSSARQSAAERIRTMIDGIGGLGEASGDLAATLRDELAAGEETGLYVLTTLVEVEERSIRLGSMLGVWIELIAELIGEGDLDTAAAQLGAGRAGAATPFKTQLMEEALGDFVASQTHLFVDSFQVEEHREGLIELLAGFGEPTTARLMERLALEESPGARRALIGILAGVTATHPAPLARFFSAEQWYVVRNAVTIAARVGGEHWVARIRPLVSHGDPRVVVEAIRALAAMVPNAATIELIQSLTHPNERVSETALLLLSASRASNLEEHLIAAMLDRRIDGVRTELAEVLFSIGTTSSRKALEDMARRPLLLTSHRRDARRAARSILASAA